MKKIPSSVDQLLCFIDKEKLQTFQDRFASSYGVSMVFLDLSGQSVTVNSQNSLLCYTVEKEHPARCRENFQMDLESMHNGESFIHICPFGIVCLYIPVYFNNQLAAYVAVGGMTYENSILPDNLKNRFHITSYNKETVQNIQSLLESLLRLINMGFSTQLTDKTAVQEEKIRSQDVPISRREHEVVKLLCIGCSNKEIAQKLGISEPTVKTHISNVLTKLNLHDRTQIVVYYYKKSIGSNLAGFL